MPASAQKTETVGLYVWTDSPDQHAFWKASGINMLQFCDLGWHRRPGILDEYYARMARDVDSAKEAGFKVYVILFANIEQWKGPQDLEPSGIGVKFYPRDKAAMQDRLNWLAKSVRSLKAVDGFSFFAGDPGGVPPDLGSATVHDWISMAKQVGEVVRREAPHAEYNVNPWAVAMWQYPNLSAMTSAFWQKELALHKEIVAEPDFVTGGVGIELPGHNYYRPLVLRNFAKDGIKAEQWPDASTVEHLRARGVKHVWAWPYFILEEADDGDTETARASGQMGSEARYIRQYIRRMQKIGMDGIIGNWSYNGHLAEALNTYAFGRFCHDTSATPENVIDEWAGYVADDTTKGALAQVIRFIENHSNYEAGLPKGSRLAPLPCDIHSADDALTQFERVVARPNPSFALPEPPVEYLRHVRVRLEHLARQR